MDAQTAASAFSALSQETRLALVRLLVAAGPSGLAAGELASRVRCPSSTLSFHLAALDRAGLTQSTRQGRNIVYAIRFAGLRELLSFLTETCCGGHPELCGDLANLLPGSGEGCGKVGQPGILFLSKHGSARAVMAEAILHKLGRGQFRAYSAGIDPDRGPQPAVLRLLEGLGHETSGLRSVPWQNFTDPDAPDLNAVVALGDVPGNISSDFGADIVMSTWPLPDPVKFKGKASERSALFAELYAGLHRRIEALIDRPFFGLSAAALKTRLDALGSTEAALGRAEAG